MPGLRAFLVIDDSVDRDDVRVVELAGQKGLIVELSALFFCVFEIGAELFQGDMAACRLVVNQEHHAAPANFFDYRVSIDFQGVSATLNTVMTAERVA